MIGYKNSLVSTLEDIGINVSDLAFVNVEIENSHPAAFNLLFPADGDTVTTTSIHFEWQRAADIDEGDNVQYHLYYTPKEDFSNQTVIENLSDTTFVPTDSLLHATRYWWKVVAEDSKGTRTQCNQVYSFVTGHVTAVEDGSIKIPNEFFLSQNYPNPFNPSTSITFGVKKSCQVILKMYNVRGQEIQTLADGFYHPGVYKVSVDLSGLTSGLYIYKIKMGIFESAKKMVYSK